MGTRHSREELLAGALALAGEEGLSLLTYGRLATRLGVSDRILVYYFPTKDALLAEVLAALGVQLQASLAAACTEPVPDHLALLRAAWPVLTRPEAQPAFALFFEASGLAAAGREPFRTVVPHFIEAWITWAAHLIEGTRAHRRTEAETAIAVIDGLLLLRQLAGPGPSDRAARRLGIR